jgi:DegV family protein with EDD domain
MDDKLAQRTFMTKISVITDTDSSLPQELAEQYHLLQVPISIHLDETFFGSDLTITNEALFKKIDEIEKLPTTAAPNPAVFIEYFKRVFNEQKPDTLIYFAVSSKMSATLQSAQIAAADLKNHDIRVIDSRTLSMAQGYMALAAAEAARNGAAVEDVIGAAEKVRERTVLYGALSTLKYLSMSGRVSHVAAGMASLLDIKPVLSVRNGKLDMLEKVRTRSKSWRHMLELLQTDGRAIEKMAVLHVNDKPAARQFEALLKTELDCPAEITVVDINPGLAVHTGAGLVGVCAVFGK